MLLEQCVTVQYIGNTAIYSDKARIKQIYRHWCYGYTFEINFVTLDLCQNSCINRDFCWAYCCKFCRCCTNTNSFVGWYISPPNGFPYKTRHYVTDCVYLLVLILILFRLAYCIFFCGSRLVNVDYSNNLPLLMKNCTSYCKSGREKSLNWNVWVAMISN